MDILKERTVTLTFYGEEIEILESILDKFHDESDGVGFSKVRFDDKEARMLQGIYDNIKKEEAE